MENIQKNTLTDREAEELIKEYLIRHSFTPKRFDTKKLVKGVKSPDFKVFNGDLLFFYSEVKNPLLLLNEITKMFHWTTSISKIRRFIHRAVEQFYDVDTNHKFPWIIAFTSTHMQLNWTNFTDAYLGYVARSGKMIYDLRKEKYVINYNEDVSMIDAYIWCQVNAESKRIHQYVPYFNSESKLKNKVEMIMQELKPFESEDIVDANMRKYK